AGLPGIGTFGLEREGYLIDDERTRKRRRAYQGHVARVLALSGVNPGTASMQAERIVELEATMAREQPLPTVSLREWKAYLRWRLMDAIAPACAGRFAAERKRHEGNPPELWRTLLDLLDPALGRDLANRYVERFVSLRERPRAYDFLDRMRPAPERSSCIIDRADHLGNLLRLRAFAARQADHPLPRMAILEVLVVLMTQIDLDPE
ncbi:MAG: hypothetical protein ACYCW6_01545, partial [Candidatus Xenobia bacterium]